MTSLGLAALLCLLGPVAAGCSDDEGNVAGPESTPTSPIPVPEGVELTEPGGTVSVGEPVVATYVQGPQRAAVVEVSVTRIEQGKGRDFVGYQLDRSTAASTPWYVEATMKVLAVEGQGPVTLPLFGFDSTNTFFPAAAVPSSFGPCPPPATKPLREGERVRGCLVFFVPPKARFKAVQLRAQDGVAPISWSVPGKG